MYTRTALHSAGPCSSSRCCTHTGALTAFRSPRLRGTSAHTVPARGNLTYRNVDRRALSTASNAAAHETSEEEQGVGWKQVDKKLDEFVALVAMLPLLRPVNDILWNPSLLLWQRIAEIPARYRPLIVERLEPGSIRVLWRYSMFRYIWDSEQADLAFSSYSLLDDFPTKPGQIVTYRGRVEECILAARAKLDTYDDPALDLQRLELAEDPERYDTWRFEHQFFLHPESRELYGRVKGPRLFGILPTSRLPWYCRVDIQLCTTPVKEDAGADMTMVFRDPDRPDGAIGLDEESLPYWWWPQPEPGTVSPFSEGERDYVRVVGPGLLVGCAYPPGDSAQLGQEREFLYFAMAKQGTEQVPGVEEPEASTPGATSSSGQQRSAASRSMPSRLRQASQAFTAQAAKAEADRRSGGAEPGMQPQASSSSGPLSAYLGAQRRPAAAGPSADGAMQQQQQHPAGGGVAGSAGGAGSLAGALGGRSSGTRGGEGSGGGGGGVQGPEMQQAVMQRALAAAAAARQLALELRKRKRDLSANGEQS